MIKAWGWVPGPGRLPPMSPFPSSIKEKQGWIQFLVPKPRCTSESPGGSASRPVTTLPRLQEASRDPVLGNSRIRCPRKLLLGSASALSSPRSRGG